MLLCTLYTALRRSFGPVECWEGQGTVECWEGQGTVECWEGQGTVECWVGQGTVECWEGQGTGECWEGQGTGEDSVVNDFVIGTAVQMEHLGRTETHRTF